jgi:nitroreductase / dihydropteridine reductase
MDLIQTLNWRYATKRMNGQSVPQEKIDRILEATRLSASSLGLQPYTIFVINDKELLEKIQAVSNNQPQISACSHLLVFASWDNLTNERIDGFVEDFEEARGSLPESMVAYIDRLRSMTQRPAEDNFNWLARQSYIALGTALVAAANEQVDSTPMEGFDNAELDKLLNLNAEGLRSVLIMPIGYRDAGNDFLVNLPKVRRSAEKLFAKR